MAAIETTLFSLDAIAASGQVFTWRRVEDGWLVASGERRCLLSQEGDAEKGVVFVRRADGSDVDADELAYWRHYLALDVDYEKILDELAMPTEVMEVGAGIRVLAQDWWDTAPCSTQAAGAYPGRASWGTFSPTTRLRPASSWGTEGPTWRRLRGGRRGGTPGGLTAGTFRLMSRWRSSRRAPALVPLFGLEYLEAVPRDTWIKRAEREHRVAWDARWGGIQQQFVFAWMREKGRGK